MPEKGYFITNTEEYITEEGAKKSRKIYPGDFILSNSMSFGRPYISKIEGCIHDGWLSISDFHQTFIPSFLYHLLRSNLIQNEFSRRASSGTVRNLNADIVKSVSIPLPPLAIQKKIVDILDQFFTLEAQLEAQLEAELKARTKQYHYYRNALLSFEKDTITRHPLHNLLTQLCPKGVEYKELQEIFITRNGYTPSKANKDFWTNGTIPWFRMEDIRENGRVLSNSLQHVTKEAVKGGKLFPANSIIIATSATIGEHALITVPHLSNQRFTSLSIKPEYANILDIKFIFYYGFILSEWCHNNTATSSFPSVDMAGFKKFLIPLPPLAIQEEIVSILDRFDALVNDISIGLPAEITARKKQYHYYRDRLLNFETYQRE